MQDQVEEPLKMIVTGNLCFILCCVCYLIWWCIAFRPNFKAPGILSAGLFFLTALLGIAGVIYSVNGIKEQLDTKELFPISAAVIGGIVLYFALFYLTSFFLHRQLTTELFLIIGWGILAFCEINALYSFGRFHTTTAVIFLISTLIVIVVSLICYLLYYQLSPEKRYIDGMIPLILIGVEMTVITLCSHSATGG